MTRGSQYLGGVLALVCSFGTVGCLPLPIPHMQLVTPRVSGRVYTSVGQPSSALHLALTAHEKDTTCTRPSVRTTTDSLGAFAVPFIEERKTIYWLTLIENPGGAKAYWLCANAEAGSDVPSYQTRTQISGNLDGDTLECLDWSWNGKRVVVCNTGREARFLVGGMWVQRADTGAYRVILADQDRYGSVFRGYIQWIEGLGTAGRDTVFATVELPGNAELARQPGGPILGSENGTWYLTVLSTRRTTGNNPRPLKFELGPPGEIHAVQN
jgi:hypothetical protein